MKTRLFACMTVAAVVAAPAFGQSGAEVLKSKGCLNCHAADQKKVGPSFKDIAARNKPEAAAGIVARLKNGKGHPKVAGSDAELKAAVDHILSQK